MHALVCDPAEPDRRGTGPASTHLHRNLGCAMPTRFSAAMGLAPLMLAGCYPPDTKQATAEVARFHAAYNAGRFDMLVGMTTPMFRAVSGPEKFGAMMGKVRRKLGREIGTETVNWSVNIGTGGATTVLQEMTTYEHGRARETFTFGELGGRPALNGYNINSPDLL
ncbi:hypothetical protein [uncultured Sphingomonas sp.]|uniref:hypothetical protein n=1 Tax=uncultured Sphingomonas sp. TaxID=158754 RepID=UPI002595D373|nr:hypothetical protein [uncultured Sphingomonas sp.]